MRVCFEHELAKVARELARSVGPADWIVLEGPMGAGKSTFARYFVQALQPEVRFEGSPTFPIAHEYPNGRRTIVHLDLYRIKSPRDLEHAGVESYFWERDALVIVEWLSLFPEFEASILEDSSGARTIWQVTLGFVEDGLARSILVQRRDRKGLRSKHE